MADVFISYSRRDSEFVRRLHDRLADLGRDVWVDWEDIPPTANWWQEICNAIEAADTFVFVISPDSVQSQICRDEVQYAVDNNKRFVPLLYRDLRDTGTEIHPAIHTHNWIPFTDATDVDTAFKTLLQAIDTDLSYVREHTRLLVRAREWQAKTRDSSFLLTGVELSDAKKWLDSGHGKHPEPTELQLNYILASQTAQTTRQRIFFIALSVAFAVAIVLISVAFLLFRETQEAREQLVSQNATIDAQRTRVGQSSNSVVESVNATLTAQSQQNVVQSTVVGFQHTAAAAEGRAIAAEATLTQVSGNLAQVVSDNATLVAQVNASGGGGTTSTVASAGGSISYGQSVSGALTQNQDFWTFNGSAGDVITIAMTSADFDTYLVLIDPTGQQGAFDDDGGSGLNSLIAGFPLPVSGTYTIVARSFADSGSGSYTLSVSSGGSSAPTSLPESTDTETPINTEAPMGTEEAIETVSDIGLTATTIIETATAVANVVQTQTVQANLTQTTQALADTPTPTMTSRSVTTATAVASATPTANPVDVNAAQQTATSLAATIKATIPTATETERPPSATPMATFTPMPSATPLPDLFLAPTLVRIPPPTGGGSLSNFLVSPSGNDEDCARNGGAGPCATIGRALELSQPGDVIALEEGVYSETLVLHHDVTLIGFGDPTLTLINGNGMGTTITIDGDVTAQISFVTITGGNSSDDGGGILNDGTLRLFGVTIYGNVSATVGGGIANYGNLVAENSSIENNYADVGGGIYNDGGGLMILAETTTTIGSNSASSGRGADIYDAATGVSSQTDVCPALAQQAIEAASRVCDGLHINEACYGGGLVEADDLDGEPLPFNQPGDRVSLSDVDQIYLEQAAPGSPDWGVVLLNVQADIPGALPGQGVTIVVFSVDIDQPELQIGRQAAVNTPSDTLNVRSGPGLNNRVVTELRDRTVVTIIDGPVEADGLEWWQVELDDGRQGWSAAFVEDEFGVLDTLQPEIDLTEIDQQAYFLRTGIGSTTCSPLPLDGIPIRQPEGAAQLGVDINTIYIEYIEGE